jgi:hypothetical protein
VVVFILLLSAPFVAFGVWMLFSDAQGLAALWLSLVLVGTLAFLRLLSRAFAARAIDD